MFKPHMAQRLSEPLWVRQDRSRPTGISREYPQSSTSIHTFYNEPHGTTFSSFSTLEFSFFLFPFPLPIVRRSTAIPAGFVPLPVCAGFLVLLTGDMSSSRLPPPNHSQAWKKPPHTPEENINMDGMCTAYGDGTMGNTWFQFNKTLTFPGLFFFFLFFPILWLVAEL